MSHPALLKSNTGTPPDPSRDGPADVTHPPPGFHPPHGGLTGRSQRHQNRDFYGPGTVPPRTVGPTYSAVDFPGSRSTTFAAPRSFFTSPFSASGVPWSSGKVP